MLNTNEMNKIFINSTLTVESINTTSLLFNCGKVVSRNKYNISNHTLNINEESNGYLALYENINSAHYHEYEIELTYGNTIISGIDIFNNELTNLDETAIVFVNGYKLYEEDYKIENDKVIIIPKITNKKRKSTVIIYTSKNIVYEGNVKEDKTWNGHTNTLSLKGYDHLRYVFFKNNEMIDSNSITKKDNQITINTVITDEDFVEYYRLPADTSKLYFKTENGYHTYGPRDDTGKLIPNPYNAIATLDSVARLAIDNIRTGFFIKEDSQQGALLIVDEDFEKYTLKCIELETFPKTTLKSDEFYVQVPEAKSILNYTSNFDSDNIVFKEMLTVFQRTLLDEAYDSIQRLKDIRDINRVDSSNINQLINLLGMKINVTDMNLIQRHNLLEELNSFYRIVGTKASLNFYNAISKTSRRILRIDQLFTPIKDSTTTEDTYYRYVTFRTAAELGAKIHQEYVYDHEDYGSVDMLANDNESLRNQPRFSGVLENPKVGPIFKSPRDAYVISPEGKTVKTNIDVNLNKYVKLPQMGPNQPTIDYGYITDKYTSALDYGSVADPITGHWIEWTEWERDSNWYPTNHVEISLETPTDINYDVFMQLFTNTFYDIASTVLYIHNIVQSYTFGDENPTIIDNGKEITDVKLNMLTGPTYNRQCYSFASDGNIQPAVHEIVEPIWYEITSYNYAIEDNSKVVANVKAMTTYSKYELKENIVGNLIEENGRSYIVEIGTLDKKIGYRSDKAVRLVFNAKTHKICYNSSNENNSPSWVIKDFENNIVGYVENKKDLTDDTGKKIGKVLDRFVYLALDNNGIPFGYVGGNNLVYGKNTDCITWPENFKKTINCILYTSEWRSKQDNTNIIENPISYTKMTQDDIDFSWEVKNSIYTIKNTCKLADESLQENTWKLCLPTDIKFKYGDSILNFAPLAWDITKEPDKIFSSEENLTTYNLPIKANCKLGDIIANAKGKLEVEAIVFQDVDYLVIRYKWTDGKDVDSYTRITNSPNNDISGYGIGWYSNSNYYIPISNTSYETNLMNWSGDNTGQGQESILVNVTNMNKFFADDLPEIVDIDLRCGWYNTVGKEPVYIEIDGYKNGTMYQDGHAYKNRDGELKYSIEEKILNMNNTQTCHDKTYTTPPENWDVHSVATLYYNRLTKEATLVITPSQDKTTIAPPIVLE